MRRDVVMCLLLLMSVVTASAQYKIVIQGTSFNVELDSRRMEAAIRDYEYKVDDSKYPIRKGTRELKAIGGDRDNVRTLVIPAKFKANDGQEYTVTTIGRAAFAGYQNIYYVVIPETVTTIEDYAFFRTSIVSVAIPNSVVSIGQRVFGRCPYLKSLIIPQGLSMDDNSYKDSEEVFVWYHTADAKPAVAQSTPKTASGPARPVAAAQPQVITQAAPKAPSPTPEAVPAVPKKETAVISDVDENIPSTGWQNDETFVLIVANENYQKVAKVECALNDGRAFKKYCQQTLGIPADHIRLLENATLGQMAADVGWLSLAAKAYEGDVRIIIYYAGHGMPNEKDGSTYLLPVDNPGSTFGAYGLNNLYKDLGGLNAKSVTLFLDACFSGSQRGDGMLASARGLAMKPKMENPLGNMVVFTAAQEDETAWPYAEKGHGLFTYFLLKKLQETKGEVDYGTLGDYLRREVLRKSFGVNGKLQTPTVASSKNLTATWRSMTFK